MSNDHPGTATLAEPQGTTKKYSRHLRFYLNGELVEIEHVDPRLLLVDYLRSPEIGKTGTKKACGQGGCGACTVMLASYNADKDSVDFRSINSCMHPVAALDGMAVTTTEGLGSVETEVSAVQYQIAKDNGSQCGYCTPGWVMNMHSYLVANEGRDITQREIENIFDGNICRCTGYRPILYAMKHFASDWDPEHDEKGCMKCLVDPSEDVKHQCRSEISGQFPPDLYQPPRAVHYAKDGYQWFRPVTLDGLYEILGRLGPETVGNVKLVGGNTSIGVYDLYQWNPKILIDISQISELQRVRITDEDLILGASTTYSQAIEILQRAKEEAPSDRTSGLEALHYLAHRTAGMIVRNAATLAGNTMMVVSHVAKNTGEPFPSDMFTALASVGAQVRVGAPSWGEPREYPILDFARIYNGDEKDSEILRSEGVLLEYRIPYTQPGEVARTYKVAIRHENSHSIVNGGLRVKLDGEVVEHASIVYGGIGPIAFHVRRVEEFLVGRPWNVKTLQKALAYLTEDVRRYIHHTRARMAGLPYDGFDDAYRLALTQSYFYQFFVYVSEQCGFEISPQVRTAGERYVKAVTRGTQTYQTYEDEWPVSYPYIKLSAFMQATGEAKYTHDIALPARGLEGALVVSEKALARIHYKIPQGDRADIETLTSYLKTTFPGVYGYITYRDVPGQNVQGSGDDPIFCPMTEGDDGLEGEVHWHGQSIGLVLANTEQLAIDVAHHVQTECIAYVERSGDGTRLDPIVTIEDAVEKGSVFKDQPPYPVHIWKVTRPGTQTDWATTVGRQAVDGVECEILHADHYSDAQIHFYMETQSCVAEPGEHGKIKVRPSSQSPDSVMSQLMSVLGLQANQIEVAIKRVGGGYGGKTTRSPWIASPTAVAAVATKRPVRVALKREIDTATVGRRHPLRSYLQVAIGTGDDNPDNRGKLVGLNAKYWFDGGGTYDCSFVVMDCLQLRSDSAYMVPNYQSAGEVAKTNKTSNTAYRAFGLIQSMVSVEDAIERASHRIGMLAEDVRAKNLYQLGDATPYGEYLNYCYMKDVYDYARDVSNFDQRLQEVQEFNSRNRWRKRGICLMPLKYGSGFNLSSLEQTGGLVEVYKQDGTVLLRQGAVEIGQGAHTKIVQIASYALNVPLELINIAGSNTSVVPNPSSTGASTGTAYGGGAIKQAAGILRKRLEEYCLTLLKENGATWCQENGVNFWDYEEGWRATVELDGKPELMWKNIISKAFDDRVDLSAEARFRQPGGETIDTGLTFHEGAYETVQHFVGFTFNAACSEVEIDVLTGETFIRRCDVIYDMGKSLNPAIDVGQVEGAFMQGVGYVLTEKVIFQPDGPDKGQCNTLNTWTYKPPATSTVPEELHVYLYPRENSKDVPENPNDLMSAKEVGEPPLVLATTVFCAVKKAIMAFREEVGRAEEWVNMPAPATPEVVRTACDVQPEDMTL